jgi:hypothetical protein
MVDSDHDRGAADDRLSEVFEPDILLPIQYFAALKRKQYSCGEHRLLIAILQDAIECFQKHIHARDSKRRQLYVDAEAWITDPEDEGPFSFTNICELLGMNPDYLRVGLLDWRDCERARRRGRLLHAVVSQPGCETTSHTQGSVPLPLHELQLEALSPDR